MNWKQVQERWEPMVELLEEKGFGNCPFSEVYRAAEAEMAAMLEDTKQVEANYEHALETIEDLEDTIAGLVQDIEDRDDELKDWRQGT